LAEDPLEKWHRPEICTLVENPYMLQKVAQAAAKTHGGKARKLVLEIDNPSKLWSMASKIAQKLCY
jgi:hypothetical protein